ncbi:MAG: hypothetical protein KC505_11155 [Myxococcales bacterium]|nr:hypothetical protein [Myxococcales bacterium]
MRYVKDNKREQRRILKCLDKLRKNPYVAVGVLQDKPHDEHFSMVDLAAVHEFGTKDGKIPQRSFIRSTCDAKQKKYISFLRKLQSQLFKGTITVKQALEQLGERISKDMVQSINRGIKPELKVQTIKRKKSSKPLIDSGVLKGNITHEVRGAS